MRIEQRIHALADWLRALVRRRDAERDLNDELRYHVEQQTAANVAAGMEPTAAHRAALIALGGIERRKDESRDVRGLTLIDTTAQDLRYAVQVVRSNPGFTCAVALTLALGIGAAATMFGIVDRLLLRPPAHVASATQLRRLYATLTLPSRDEMTTSYVGYSAYTALGADKESLDGVAAYSESEWRVGTGGDARLLEGSAATAGFFPLVGVTASVGRVFDAEEDDPRHSSNVVVLGDAFWRREYGASTDAVGRTMTIADKPFTIIGVLPPGFTGVELGEVDFWIPMSSGQHPRDDWTTTWQAQWLNVVARVKPGGKPADDSRMAVAVSRAAQNAPEPMWRSAQFSLRPIAFDPRGSRSPVDVVAQWLIAVAAIVLVITCANVANLLLARALRRRREIAVRLAMGISRSRLFRLLVTESLVLAALGGVGGIVIAYAAGTAVRAHFLPGVLWDSSPVDARVVVVASVLVVLTGVLVGLLPAVQAGRTDVVSALKEGARGEGVRQSRLRAVLLVGESALAVALLVTASLFVRSLMNVRALDLGFEPERVLSVGVQWPADEDKIRRNADWERLRASVAARGVYEHVALAVGTPFGNGFGVPLRVPGRDSLPQVGDGYDIAAVSPDYFATIGTRMVHGRLFGATEGVGTEPVTIVDETMARALWPNESAIGHCLLIGGDKSVPCARIVGIVRDARRSGLRPTPEMQYYIPLGQEVGFGGTELLVRPHGNADVAVGDLRAEIAHDAPSARFIRVRAMQDRIDPLIRPWRMGAGLFGMFGVLALIVAATGLYSVVSYATTQRMHEFGVRLALGARGSHVVRIVLVSAVRVTVVGTLLGIGMSVAAAHWLQPLLFDESARDPAALTLVASTLLVVALVAGLAPAARAMRVEPVNVLRSE